MTILILSTGGTFDKEYNEINGTLAFRKTHVPELLQLGRCNAAVNIENLMLIDSLQMTDAHRERIVTRVAVAPECHVVITHGTDTMDQTARALAKANLSKTIVLTGAMIPIKFGSSDGLFNLGSAIAFAQSLAQGVYIAMNGRYFTWDKVRKDRERGVFVDI